MKDDEVDISVCIATWSRPAGLRRLLLSLQETRADKRFSTQIVVVDNDADGSAGAIVDDLRSRLPPIVYLVEPQRGISFARNRALALARGHWIAFIDDDEEACPGWLQAFWEAARTCEAEGFFGPVRPVAEGVAPTWFRMQAFFPYAELGDGRRIDATHTRTGNAFVRRSLLGEAPFDPAFALTGGGDYELFARLVDAGARFHWCASAETRDYLPASRLTWSWLLQRAFRGGYTFTLVDRRRHPGLARDLQRITRATAGAVALTLLLPFAALRGYSEALLRLRRIAIQLGHLWTYLGPPVAPYRTEELAQRRDAEAPRKS